MNGEIQLSKWWQTDSCKRAYERANKAKAERLAKVRRDVEERKAKLQREVEQWEPI